MHISEPKKIGGYKVLVANFGAVGLASDLGNKISENNPSYDFVILWSYHTGNKEYSIMLRTRNDNIDLSQIAKTFGGGGHPRAARFTWKGQIDNLWQFMDSKIKKTSKKSKSKFKTKKSKKSKSKSKNTF